MMKDREHKHLNALQQQIKESQARRQQEQEERRKYPVPVFVDNKRDKKYDCNNCHNKFPIQRLSKTNQIQIDDPHGDYDYY
jgi:hypothetical protein